MEQIGFLGSFDKKDILIDVGKVMTELGKKVLVVDATLMQRLKYIVPNVSNNGSITYISEYQGVDVALGFMNLMGIAQYLRTNQIPYDFVLVDTDNVQTMNSFMIPRLKTNFFVTSYDQYEISRMIENFQYLNQPMEVIKVIISANNTPEQARYLEHLMEKTPVRLKKAEVHFADTIEDRKATLENQLMKEIKLKRYTNSFKDSLEYLVAVAAENIINQAEIKKIIKKL